MPRDGSNIYSQPFPDVVEDTTIESTVYNGFTNDVSADLNAARPIVAGGTGATSADQALFNLAAEKATQVVTNYDSHLWVPGSFRSAAGATGAPTVNAFAGTAIIGEALANPPTNQNVVLEARDLGDASVPGLKYIREKTAGVWSAWALDVGSQAIRYDADQNLTEVQKAQGRENIYAAPLDALAYNGMQINGGFNVSQERGTTAFSGHGYVCDGWYIFGQTSGAGLAVSHAFNSTGLSGFTHYLNTYVFTAQASLGANDLYMAVSQIEGYRVARLAFGSASAMPITIAFWSWHTLPGVYSVSLGNVSSNRSYVATYTQNVASAQEYKIITIPGDTGGTWATDNTIGIQVRFAFAAGSAYTTASANVWQAGNFTATTGQVNGYSSTANNFRIHGVVVLPGIEAPSAARSPLIMRPFDQELVTCKRYYQQFGGSDLNEVFASGQCASTTSSFFHLPLNPEMRAAPAFSLAGLTAVHAANTSVVSLTNLTLSVSARYFVTLSGTTAGGLVAGNATKLIANSDLNARIKFDARL